MVVDVLEPDVDRENAPIVSERRTRLSLLFLAAPDPVEEADLAFVASRILHGSAQDGGRHRRLTLLEETHAERLRRGDAHVLPRKRLLEFGDRLVQQTHLFERHAE